MHVNNLVWGVAYANPYQALYSGQSQLMCPLIPLNGEDEEDGDGDGPPGNLGWDWGCGPDKFP